MAKFRFTNDSTKKVSANIRAAGVKQKNRLATALLLWGDDTVAAVQEEIQSAGAFDQGQLVAATTRTAVERTGSKLRLAVFNPLEYATVVEFGRRPRTGHPPLLPLVGWAGRKGIVHNLPRNISFGGAWAKKWAASAAIMRAILKRRGGAKKPTKKQQMDAIVHDLLIIRFIARKIFEQGTKGRHPFSKAWDRRTQVFRREIAANAKMLK